MIEFATIVLMKDDKKKKFIKWSIIIGLVLLIIFVIATSIVLHFKRQDLDNLNNKLENVSQEDLEDELQNKNHNHLFFKIDEDFYINFYNFV